MLQDSRRKQRRGESSRTDALWHAVQSRDRGADGEFVYAVRSTGVYCRPSCPSRKPRREQVVFFPLPEAAEQRGFRACRRCRPRTVRAQDPSTQAVARICREIESRILSNADAGSGENRLTLAARKPSSGSHAAAPSARVLCHLAVRLSPRGFAGR